MPIKSKTKIAVYGFGSMPVIWRHLYDIANLEKVDIAWCAILPTPNWRELIYDELPKEDVLDIYRELPKESTNDLSCVSNYQGSLAEDVDADKRPNWWLQGAHRINRGIDYYRLYRKFLSDRRVTHLLMPTIESSGAKIAVAVAKELGIRPMVLTDMRNLTGTYFAVDAEESPPAYGAATDELRVQAAQFIEEFRRNARPARALPIEFSSGEDRKLDDFAPSLHKRAFRFVQHSIERPDLFSIDTIRVSGMRNIPILRKLVRDVRTQRNAAQFDIGALDELPRKFIYYPLQYSPEASINTPAPYFVDQLRAIDALRYAMPSDFVLLVKEHWACIPVRPVNYMRQIRRRAGVVVARCDLSSLELIKRACLTATVTGTAALEAALLGRPALVLASFLPAHALGHVAALGSLRADIEGALGAHTADEGLIDRIARLMSVRYPFFYGSTNEPGEPMLRLGNMRRFLLSLMEHIEREHAAQ